MKILNSLKIKIFADGANFEDIINLNKKEFIKGFTTNPSLMKKAKIQNYESFAKDLLNQIKDKPVSFEVFSDELDEMEKQAEKIATWGKNVNVKIPITNTKNISTKELIHKLSQKGIICNITAIFTLEQIKEVVEVLHNETPAILSVFAGRIYDCGQDANKIMKEICQITKNDSKCKVLWASPRMPYDYISAINCGAQIITMQLSQIKN